jgi:hypothetical protein
VIDRVTIQVERLFKTHTKTSANACWGMEPNDTSGLGVEQMQKEGRMEEE